MPFPAMPSASWQKLWTELLIKGDPGEMPTGADPISSETAFAHARLNYAENLLETGLRNHSVLSHWSEDGHVKSWSRGELKEYAGRFAAAFSAMGVKSSDCVLLALPQIPQKLAAILGASWYGVTCILLDPWKLTGDLSLPAPVKMAVVPDGMRFEGKWQDGADGVKSALELVGPDGHVVVVPVAGSRTDLREHDAVIPWEDWQRMGQGGGVAWGYQDFTHPLCWVEGDTGWVQLLTGTELLRGLALWKVQMGVGEDDVALLLSNGRPRDLIPAGCALSSGAELIINEGALSAMNDQIAFRIMEREQVTHLVLGPGTEYLLDPELPPVHDNHFLDTLKRVHVLSGQSVASGLIHHFPFLLLDEL